MSWLSTLLRALGIRTRRKPDPSPPPPPPVDPNVPPPVGGSRVIQVSDEAGLLNRGYSYWSQAWLSQDGRCYVFAGHASGATRFYAVTLAGLTPIERLGPLVPYVGEAEGWYWDRHGWIYLTEGPRLRRVNPFTGEDVVVFDISGEFPGCRLWQAHSSDDGQVHSATVQQIVEHGAYPRIGTVVYRQGRIEKYPSAGALDESQVDRSGQYLVIKEGEDNIVVTLGPGDVRMIFDAGGALGHSDCGPGFMVGEDNIRGACVRVDLATFERTVLFETWGMGHVSTRGGRILVSSPEFLTELDAAGNQVTRVEHGMVGEGYDYQVHGTLSPCGRVAAFVSNKTGRFELYLVVLG